MSTSAHYATRLSDEQWHVLQLLLPEPKWQPGGPGRTPLDLRRVVDGMFYVHKTGCQWRMMLHDFGNGMTIYGYFRRWRQQGIWADLMETLRTWERRDQGSKDDPSAGCADTQTIKVTTQHQEVGFDGNKKIKVMMNQPQIREVIFALALLGNHMMNVMNVEVPAIFQVLVADRTDALLPLDEWSAINTTN